MTFDLVSRVARRFTCEVTAAVIGLAACLLPAQAQELKIGARSDIVIDPHSSWAMSNTQYFYHYLGFMNWLDESDKVVPRMAKSATAVSPNLWEVKLNEGLKFSNGAPVTVNDVVASYERARTLPNAIGTFAGLFAGLKEMKAIDDLTMHVVTSRPYPTWPATMTQISVLPAEVAKTATQADFSSGRANISSSAYKFVEYVPANRLVVERNSAYVGPKARWDKVTFRILTNNATRVAALLSGDVDMIDGVPPEDAATIAKDPRFTLYTGPSDRIIMLAMDSSRDVSPFITDLQGNKLTTNPLKDVRVRRAMSLAIDRELIRDRVMDGHSIPNNQLIPKGLGGYAANIPEAKVDLPKARALMKEAGWADGFGIALACPEGRYVNASKICQAAAQMLGRINIKVTVEVMPYGVFASRVTNKTGDRASLMLFGWGASSSGEANVLQKAIHTWDKEQRLGAWNIGMYSNPEVDKLIVKGLSTLDAKERHAIQAEAMTKAMEDVAAIPLHTQVVIVATRKGLKYTVQANECTLADFVEPTSN